MPFWTDWLLCVAPFGEGLTRLNPSRFRRDPFRGLCLQNVAGHKIQAATAGGRVCPVSGFAVPDQDSAGTHPIVPLLNVQARSVTPATDWAGNSAGP